MLHGFQLRPKLFNKRSESYIVEKNLVLSVVRDVGDLVRKQARVDGVDHRSGARDRVVDLEVPVAVPRERGDAIGGLDPEALQRIGELARADVRLAEGVAVNRPALDRLRDDLRIAVVAIGM